MSNSITIDQAADEFIANIGEFVKQYKAKHELFPEIYPLALPENNVGLWAEFIMDFHCTGKV